MNEDLSKNINLVTKAMWLSDDVIILQDDHWNYVFLWINKIPQVLWPKFIITVLTGNILLEKKWKIGFF